jgi:hypothetical protein
MPPSPVAGLGSRRASRCRGVGRLLVIRVGDLAAAGLADRNEGHGRSIRQVRPRGRSG